MAPAETAFTAHPCRAPGCSGLRSQGNLTRPSLKRAARGGGLCGGGSCVQQRGLQAGQPCHRTHCGGLDWGRPACLLLPTHIPHVYSMPQHQGRVHAWSALTWTQGGRPHPPSRPHSHLPHLSSGPHAHLPQPSPGFSSPPLLLPGEGLLTCSVDEHQVD